MTKKHESGIAATTEIRTIQEPLLLNVRAASAFIGITAWQLRGLIWAKKIPVVQIGRKLFLRRATLVRFAENEEGKYRVGA